MKKCELSVDGMTCSACAVHVEDAVKKVKGVRSVQVNLLTRKAKITYDETQTETAAFSEAVKKAGYVPGTVSTGGKKAPVSEAAADSDSTARNRLIASVVFAVPLFLLAMIPMLGVPLPGIHKPTGIFAYAFTQFLLLLPILFLNRSYFIAGFRTLLHGTPVMDSLIAVGAGAAVLSGVAALYGIGYGLGIGDTEIVHRFSMRLYFESAGMILTLVSLGKYLEKRAQRKTSSVIEKLVNLAPKTVILLRDGKEETVAAENAAVGDLILLRPGDTAAVDGTVAEGYSSVDESALTGESLPAEKKAGDTVMAGSVNLGGVLKIRTTQAGNETALARIIALVEEASGSKAPIARLADKISRVFVPVVMAIALAAFLLSFFVGGSGFETAFSRAIAVLVISCPCALGLATPTAIMVGIGKGAELGILIRNGEILERAGKIDTLLLDKTGTLTQGHPSVTEARPAAGVSAADLAAYAAAVESGSAHPLAEAVAAYAADLQPKALKVSDSQTIPGRGVKCIADGKEVTAGNSAFMNENGITVPETDLPTGAQTPLFFAVEKKYIGALWTEDQPKNDSASAVAELKRMKITPIMLTGDRPQAAQAVAEAVGIDRFKGGLLPQDKAAEAEKLQSEGHIIGMAGDGINDAPVLARADISIALEGGSDIAVEAADIILMKNRLSDAVTAIRLSRKTMLNIKENLFWALFYNCLGIPAAAGLLEVLFGIPLSPMFAAAAMSLSSICVVGNALRLKRFKPHGILPEKTPAVSKGDENMETKILKIEGMMCDHCRSHVESALNAIDGIKASVNLQNAEAECRIEKPVADDVLTKAVTDAGYKVVSIS